MSKKMNYFSYRLINFYAFLLIVVLLAIAGYLQFSLGLEPCPLCIMQRVMFAIVGVLFIAGVFYRPRTATKQKVFCSSLLIFSLIGLGVAGRQVYLQNLPAGKAPACGPGFYYIVKNLPFHQAMKLMFQGTGECAAVTWRFLGLSIADWSFIFFFILAALALWQMARKI